MNWLDGLKPGDKVVVHFPKAAFVELERMIGYVERIGGPRSVTVRVENLTTETFVDGKNERASLVEWTFPLATSINLVRDRAALVRDIHKKMRNLDFVRGLTDDQLDAIHRTI